MSDEQKPDLEDEFSRLWRLGYTIPMIAHRLGIEHEKAQEIRMRLFPPLRKKVDLRSALKGARDD